MCFLRYSLKILLIFLRYPFKIYFIFDVLYIYNLGCSVDCFVGTSQKCVAAALCLRSLHQHHSDSRNDLRSENLRFWKTFSGRRYDLRSENLRFWKTFSGRRSDLRSENLRFWETFSGRWGDLRSEKVSQNLRFSDLRSFPRPEKFLRI